VVGPIAALLDVRPEFIFREFGRERAFSMACAIPVAIPKIDSAGGRRVELNILAAVWYGYL
jgi:hypothetical protein